MRTAADALSFLSLVLGAASICSAASITYTVNQTVGIGGATGNIETDGTIGVLLQSDILAYDLLLSDGTNEFELSSSPFINFFPFLGSDLSATPTELLFNFSGTDGGIVDFAVPSDDLQLAFCTVTCFFTPGAGEAIHILLFPSFTFENLSTGLSGTQVIGTAGISVSIPEPSTIVLLAGALTALFGFRKLKFPYNSR